MDPISRSALQWVRENWRTLYSDAVLSSGYIEDLDEQPPAASFMAGTPGAGKTETSERFIEQFTVKPIRIDADEFRQAIPGYTGGNSHIIQPAASLAVDKVLEETFKHKHSFLLDGTFAIGKSIQNLKRAERRGYTIQLFFVYQDPVTAWSFTKIREEKEGRHVPKEVFIDAYFSSRRNVNEAKRLFGEEVRLYLIIKDYKTNTEEVYGNIDNIDNYLDKLYTREELERILL